MTRKQPLLRKIQVTEATIAVWEWEGEGVPIFLVHATGMHGRCWDRIVEALPGRKIFAVDVRGHGWSSCPPPPYLWSHLARDITEVVERLALERTVGVGHSMGGHLLVRSAASQPSLFDRLLLLDPALLPPDVLEVLGASDDLFRPLRRSVRWTSANEMAAYLRDRGGFSNWDRRVLDDYCRYGLRPSPYGEWFDLACPPEIERAVYIGETEMDIYELLRSVDIPVHIVRARSHTEDGSPPDFFDSATWPQLVNEFRNATEVHLTESTHVFPMEQPGLAAALIAACADGALR